MYYERDLEKSLKRALTQFPAVLITGPRQAGKSTLLQHCLPNHRYVTFDDTRLRALAKEEPDLFLATHPAPVIFDEIQYVPELLPYLKMRIDQNRHDYGGYVLTGSQLFQLMEGVTETLAGRMAIFSLYPFSWREIERIPGPDPKDELQMSEQIVQGFYPEFFRVPSLDREDYFRSYVASYLERDVRSLRAISDLSRFQTFLRLLAARAGQLLNISEVAKECGISHTTARDWISVLEATYIIYLLKPYHKNHTKRLVKSPKLYFYDTGLLCYLLEISPDRFWHLRERGHIFENMVVMECLKRLSDNSIYFYRTAKGVEVDLILPKQELAYEIKLSKEPSKRDIAPLQHFQKDHPEFKGQVLCLRHDLLPLTKELSAIHWSDCLDET